MLAMMLFVHPRQRLCSSSHADRRAGCNQRAATDEPARCARASRSPTAVPTAAEPTEIPVTDIELWAGGRVTEAGPPPDDWVAYQIIKDNAKVNLKLVLLPSTQSDQDTKINAAGASNSLPDLFMVSRDVWYKLVQAGLVAKVDDLLPLMPVRTQGHYCRCRPQQAGDLGWRDVRPARSRRAAPDRFAGHPPGLARQTRPCSPPRPSMNS